MSCRRVGIDVHKRMLAVAVTDVEIESEYQFERRMFGSNPEQPRSLAAWLLEQEVDMGVPIGVLPTGPLNTLPMSREC
jgi:hypothetical protein